MEIGLVIVGACILCVLLYISFSIYNKDNVKITENSTSLTDVLPIHSIENDFIVSGNGDITIGYKLFLPEVFTLAENAADSIHLVFENMLKMLPSGTVFQQQYFVYESKYTTDAHSNNFLYNSNIRELKGKDIINAYSNIYITFTNKADKRNPQSTFLLKKAAIPFKKPFDINDRLKDAKTTILNLESSFDSLDLFSINRMDSKELNNALFDFLNLSFNTPTEDATKEIVQPISVSDNGDFKIGDKLVSIVSLVEEGANLAHLNSSKVKTRSLNGIELPDASNMYSSMLYPITLGLPFNHIVNTIIEVTNSEDTITAMKGEKASLNLIANFYQPAKEKQKEIDLFCDAVSENNYQTAYTAVNVIICDTDKANLALKTAQAKQNFANMNQSTAYIENEETANLFFASMPGNARANYRGFVNVTKQALCYIFKESLYLSATNGYLFADRFGNPAIIDLWDNPLLDNRNGIMIGPSGAGKSFLINSIILQAIIQGIDIVIIDIGGSYKNLIKLNNGKYYDSREREFFSFNPFLCPKDKNNNYIYQDNSDEDGKDDLIKTIAAVLAFIWKENKDISSVEKQLLVKSITGFYEYVNDNNIFPDMISYREYLPLFFETLESYHKSIFNVQDIMLLLEPYTIGELSYLLNSKEDIDIMNDNLLAYDMENVTGKDYFPIIAMLTLSVVIEKIKKKAGKKILIIDEALDFLVDDKFGDFIGYLFRTFRKKDGEVMIAAQNVKFIMNAAPIVRESILANSDTKVILEHGEKYKGQVESLIVINISEEEQKKILSLQRTANFREFFIKLGNSSTILRNSVSKESAVAFDSKQKTVKILETLYKETGSIPAAINRYIENDFRKKVNEELKEDISI